MTQESNTCIHTVRSARVPTPHNRSQHIQANTRRGFIQYALLTMGIMMPETSWVNLLWINIYEYTCVICWLFLLLKERIYVLLIIQYVPLAAEPGISLIILAPIKILQRNLNRSTFVVWEMKRNVSVVCVCSAPNCCDTEQRSASQPGSVASGTHGRRVSFLGYLCDLSGPSYVSSQNTLYLLKNSSIFILTSELYTAPLLELIQNHRKDSSFGTWTIICFVGEQCRDFFFYVPEGPECIAVFHFSFPIGTYITALL